MTTERTCPHCGAVVPVDRIICPHCNRTLPVASAPPSPYAAPAEPAPAAEAAGDDSRLTWEPAPGDQPAARDPALPPPPPGPEPAGPPPPPTPPLPQPPPAAPQASYQPPPPLYQPPTGQYQPPPGQYPPQGYVPGAPPTREDNFAIVGLILSIIGLLGSCCCLSFLCPIGLIFSIIAHHRRPSGLSLAGIIIGGIGSVLFVFGAIYAIYMQLHPELYEEMFRQWFDRMGMPVPPGFPSR